MKRSWLQILCIVVAGLASTTGCGNKSTQTSDATGTPSSGPAPGQYNPPTSGGHGAGGGSPEGAMGSSTPAGASSHGGPASAGPSSAGHGGPSGEQSSDSDVQASSGPSSSGHGGPASSGPSGHGGPSSGRPSMGVAGSGASPYGAGYDTSVGAGPSSGGHDGPSAGRPSMGVAGTGSPTPYGADYGAATGYNGGGPGAPGAMGTTTTGMAGYGAAAAGNPGNVPGNQNNLANARTAPANSPAIPKKLSFEERSKIAFQAGNTNRAYELAYAHSLMSTDSDAMKVATAYRVAPTKSSPSLGIQVAVGLTLTKPDGLTDLKPIGTDLQSITGSSGGAGMGPSGAMGAPGMGAPGMGGMGMGMASSQASTVSGSKSLTDAAGSLATDFIEAFKEGHAEGKWSYYFKDEELQSRAATANQSGMAGGFYQDGAGGGMLGGAANAGGNFGPAGGAGAAAGSSGPAAPGNSLQFRQSGGGLSSFGIGGGDDAQSAPGTAGVGITGPGGAGHGASGPGSAPQGVGAPGSGGPGAAGHGASAPGSMTRGGGGPGAAGHGAGAPGSMAGGPSGAVGDSGYGTAPNMSGYGAAPGSGGFGAAPGMAGQAAANANLRPAIDPADVRLEQGKVPLAPCLHYIGTGDAKSLIATAYDGGYDVLVIFEVEVTQNRRNNIITNTALIRCVVPGDSPKNVESIVKTKALTNKDVAQARKKSEDDGIDDIIKVVMRRMGEKATLQPIPDKLTPEYVIQKRLPTLLASESMSKLSKLSEVNFYFHKGYLDEAQRADFYERIAGDIAEDVLSEDLEMRESAILELLNG